MRGAARRPSAETECRRLADALDEAEPRSHILVNNAGANWFAPIADPRRRGVGPVSRVNLKGLFHLTRFLLPLMETTAIDDDPGADHQRGIGRGLKPGPLRHVRLRRVQSGRAPADPPPGPRARPSHHRERHRPRALPDRHDLGRLFAGRAAGLHGHASLGPPGRRGRGMAIFFASRAGSFVTGAVLALDGGHASVGVY